MGQLRIKPLYAILLVVGLLMLAIGGTLAVTQSTQQQSPPPDVPRYTADQVISVVHAYDPILREVPVFVEYSGQGRWWVRTKSQLIIFYEDTGRLEVIYERSSKGGWENPFRD